MAVHRLIVSYGFAADTGDADRVAERFAEDGVYDVGTMPVMEGRQGLREMILGPGHQALLPNCAHTFGPSVVKVEGDVAVAIGYTLTYKRSGDDFDLWRLSFTRIDLARKEGRWQISRRTNRLVGDEEAQAVFRAGLATLES